jgi:hypothetical protein
MATSDDPASLRFYPDLIRILDNSNKKKYHVAFATKKKKKETHNLPAGTKSSRAPLLLPKLINKNRLLNRRPLGRNSLAGQAHLLANPLDGPDLYMGQYIPCNSRKTGSRRGKAKKNINTPAQPSTPPHHQR